MDFISNFNEFVKHTAHAFAALPAVATNPFVIISVPGRGSMAGTSKTKNKEVASPALSTPVRDRSEKERAGGRDIAI